MTRPTDPRRAARRSGARLAAVSLLFLACAALGACTTDQVLDPARYWSDRLTGATIDADPSND